MKIFERDLSKPFPYAGTQPTRIDRRAAYLRRKRKATRNVRPQDLPNVSDDLAGPVGAGRVCLAMLAVWVAVAAAWWAL